MKYITIIQLIFQLIFLALIFIVIKEKTDYIYVPLLHSVGYLIGGIIALYIIFVKDGVKLIKPKINDIKTYTKDAFPIFSTDVICTVKDKLNYLLLGGMIDMSQVVTYDIGSKLTALMLKPVSILLTAIFPKMSRDRNNNQFKKMGIIVLLIVTFMVIVLNVCLKQVVYFFVGEEIDLFPIRIYILSPLVLGISQYIANCYLIARGYNKHLFYSIVITTIAYIISLSVAWRFGFLNAVLSFVVLTLISYFVELIYRLAVVQKLSRLN